MGPSVHAKISNAKMIWGRLPSFFVCGHDYDDDEVILYSNTRVFENGWDGYGMDMEFNLKFTSNPLP